MLSIATNFREYPRGVTPPADWSSRGDQTAVFPPRGYEIDPTRASWLVGLPPSGGGRGILTWNPADSDASRADQEILLSLAFFGTIGTPLLAYVRMDGSPNLDHGYAAGLNLAAGTLSIFAVGAGSAVLLASAALGAAVPTNGNPYWLRFRAQGTTMRARLWAAAVAEPGTWTVTATDSSWHDGSIGIIADQQIFSGAEIRFCGASIATNGGTAPALSTIPAGLAAWALDSGADIEITAELHYLNPDTGFLGSLFFSTHGRRTGPGDLPANEEMPPLLYDPGSPGEITAELTADALFSGPVGRSFGQAILRNPRALLARLTGYTAAGRSWIVRAGRHGWAQHRWFDLIYSATCEGEPSLEDNGTALVTLQSPDRQLTQNLAVRRYVGIQTGISLNASTATNPYITAYDLTTFSAAGRWIFSGIPTPNWHILERQAGILSEQFNLYIEGGTGCVVARASCAGVNSAILLRSPLSYVDGLAHSALFGVISQQLAFLIVDGLLVAQMTPPADVDLPAATGLRAGKNLTGGTLFDLRLYGFCPDPGGEAQSLMAARSDGTEPAIVFLSRCDDGLGASLTDISPNANSIAVGGALGVNYTWVPTDMGEVALAGKIMPLTVGAVLNAPAERIDPIRERYRLTDGASHGAILRQQGAVTATVGMSSGLINGVYEFGGATSQPVTFDHVGDPGVPETLAFALAAPQIEGLLRGPMGLTEADYDPQAIDALRSTAPFLIGFRWEGEVKGGEALASLLSWGGHYRLDRDGRIVPDLLRPPITPGPYPFQPALELSGCKYSGVRFPNPTFTLGAEFTICFWVKPFSQVPPYDGSPTLIGDAFPIVSQSDNLSWGFWCGLSLLAKGMLSFVNLPMSPTATISPASSARWGEWTFVMMAWRNGILGLHSRDIYAARKGGALTRVATENLGFSTPLQIVGQPLEIAGQVASGKSLAGSVQHVQIWNSNLGVARGQALMLSPPAGTEPGLLFYSPLTEGSGTSVKDLVSGTYGQVRGGRWAPRVIYDFRRSHSESTIRIRRNRPAWDALVPYAKNWSPLADSDIAASPSPVSFSNRAALKRSVPRRATAPDAIVLATYLDARQIDLGGDPKTGTDGVLLTQGDAAIVAAMMRYRLHPRRVAAQMIGAPRSSVSLILGDEIWAFHPDFPWEAQGAALRVIGFAPLSLASLRSTLDLWGDRLEGPGQAILADGGAPILTDSGQPLITG